MQTSSPLAALRASADWVWSGLGIGAATASAGFAAYMVAFSTGQVVPSGNFNLFTLDLHRAYVANAETANAARRPDTQPARAEDPDATAIDFTPTGTVAAAGRAATSGATTGRSEPSNRSLPGFTLRDVVDGKALVESRSKLTMVKPGSVLDGAGEVLSIERRREGWVVVTARGVIAGQKR